MTRDHRFFSAVIEDPFPAATVGPTAVWINSAGTHIDGYKEDGKRTHHALYTNGPTSQMPRFFVEGPSGWFYAIFTTGFGSGNPANLMRFKVSETETTDFSSVLATLPSDVMLDMDHPQNPLFLGPNGEVYIRARPSNVGEDFYQAKYPWGTRYYKWTQESGLTQVGGIDVAWEDFVVLYKGDVCDPPPANGPYRTVLWTNWSGFGGGVLHKIYRRFVPTLLASGRWLAADALPNGGNFDVGYSGGGANGELVPMTRTPNGEVSCLSRAYFCGDVTGQYTPIQYRSTGNDWWERNNDSLSWSPVIYGGIDYIIQNRAATTHGGLLHTLNFSFASVSPAASPYGLAWKYTMSFGEFLPTLRFRREIGASFTNGSTPPYDDCDDADVDDGLPYQGHPIMEADDKRIYYFLRGGPEDIDDLNTPYHPGGIYRATIPSVGQTPSWKSIGISELTTTLGDYYTTYPNFPASSQKGYLTNVRGMALSTRRIWVAAKRPTDSGVLLHYAKSGGNSKSISVEARSVTAAWAHRWKS